MKIDESGNLKKSFFVLKLFSFFLIMSFVACDSSDDNIEVTASGNYSRGVFVLNEGAFQTSNASISFIPADEDTVYGDLFTSANPEMEVLGDVLMDMVSVDTLSYFVLDNSHSIIVVNNKNFEYVDEITEGVNYPRHALVYNGLIYLTQWGNGGEVLAIDPQSFSIVGKIATDQGAEGIKEIDGKLWVANSGGFSYAKTVSVIDPVEMAVEENIEVGDCPQDLAVDYHGDIWVLSSGYKEYDADWNVIRETAPYLTRIDGEKLEISENFEIDLNSTPTEIAVSKDQRSIYFGGGSGGAKLWKMGVDDQELPSEIFYDASPYGIFVHPETGNIYCGMSPNFGEPGFVTILDNNGNEIEKITENIGISPGAFYFVNN